MEVKVYNNVLDQKYETFEYDTSKPLLEQIEQHINKDTYKETLVECYDSETGETFYAPMFEDNIENQSVVISVNGRSVDATYQPVDSDIVSVVFLPASNERAVNNAMGGFLGFLAGAAIGALIGGPIGAFILGSAGFIFGAIETDTYQRWKETKKNQLSSSTNGKEGSQSPDMRGAENASLRNNNFPFVIGKHLITPFVVGDPVTEYSGTRGVDAYVRILLCAGYAPLKLTDFKLGEFWLAYNRSHQIGTGTTITKETYLSGLLRGYSYGGTPDNGDILDYWKNNDISLEILQQPSQTGEAITIDEVYQEHTTIDLANRPQVSAATMQAAGWTEVEPGTYCTLYSQGYSTEDEKTTVLVTPILSDGTVLSPSDTETYANKLLNEETIGVDILLNTFYGVDSIEQSNEYAQGLHENQEAYYNHEHFPDGVRYGTIYPYAVNDQQINANVLFVADKELDEQAQVTYKGTSFPNMFKTNGVWFTDSCPRKFTVNIDFPSGLYETHTRTQTVDNNSTTKVIYNKIPLWVCAQWRIYNQNNASSDSTGGDYSSWNNLDFGYTDNFNINVEPITGLVISGNAYNDVDAHDGNDFGNKRKIGTYNKLYQSFLNKDLQNFQNIGGENGISEIRLSATVTLTNEQIAQLMADTNPGHFIEIRVIRISPNYINEIEDSDSSERSVNTGASSYSDHMKVISVVTESFDEEEYVKTGQVVPIRPLKDDDYRKFCLIAIKAKADAAGYLSNQLSQLNCIAESFSPYWDYEANKIKPDDVYAVRKYYGYYDQNDNRVNRSTDLGVTQREVTRAEYEQARQDGFNWDRQDCGSNYSSVMRRIVFTSQETHNGQPAYKLTQEAAKYNNNSVVSGFMLGCVGPQNGPIGLGYENIDLLSIGDWALKTNALIDGTTANRTITYNGVVYHKDDIIPLRMEANGYVYSGQKLEDILQKLAFAGRAAWCADENGRIRVVMDGPVDYTVGAINAQNCISSSNTFNYEELPAGYLVSFSDENDGYETNQFYVWSDGNSEKSYHGQVNPFSVEFVTNNYQMWSLGRYVLATILQSKEVLTRKIGVEGNLFKLGDVILVQSEDLLIGDCSGRIQDVIEDDDYIYGFISDAPYEFTAEQSSEDDCSTQGVTVLQPGYLGKSNAVTVPIAMPKIHTVYRQVVPQGTENPQEEGWYEKVAGQYVLTTDTSVIQGKKYYEAVITYKLEKGTTNVVLFEEGLPKGNNDTSATNTVKYKFKTGDICMFGIRDKISAPYKITKIKPEKDGCFTETLVPYNEDVYMAGEELPSFQNYITPPQVTEPPVSLNEGPSTVSEVLQSQQSLAKQVNNVVNGQTEVEPPEVVTGLSAVAEENGINIQWSPLPADGLRNVIKHYTVHISKNNGTTWITYDTKDSQFFYTFDRTTDGYPEATPLHSNWLVKVSSVNIYGKPGDGDPSNECTPQYVNVSTYGTWIIPQVVVTQEVLDRTVVLTAVYVNNDGKQIYGNIQTLIKIKRLGNTDIGDAGRTYNEMYCTPADETYYTPEFSELIGITETADSQALNGDTEWNYKVFEDGEAKTDYYSSPTNKITHTLPLIGQNPRIYKLGNIPLIKAKEPGHESDPNVPVYKWDTITTRNIPETPIAGNVYYYTGNDVIENNELVFAQYGYYLCNGYTEVTPSGDENPQELRWYILDDGQYVPSTDTTVVSGTTYYEVEWEQVYCKSLAVPTTYEYLIGMTNEAYPEVSGEKTGSFAAPVVAIALPTNIADIVHSHEHYKDLFVEKLSAIVANVGLIQQGGFGSFADKLNYWALSTLTAEESGVPGGVLKGAFRVGGENEYFMVTPHLNGEYTIELKAGNIELTTTSTGSGMDFLKGTRVYTPNKDRCLELTPSGLYIKKYNPSMQGDDKYETFSQVIINGNNDLIIANTSVIPEFGYQVNADVYHFDSNDPEEDENHNNPQGIDCDGIIQFVDEQDRLLDTNSNTCFNGIVKKDIQNFNGKVGFATKSSEIQIGQKAINIIDASFEDIQAQLDGYNAAMRQTSTTDPTKTLGAYLGLNDTQIQNGIFY